MQKKLNEYNGHKKGAYTSRLTNIYQQNVLTKNGDPSCFNVLCQSDIQTMSDSCHTFNEISFVVKNCHPSFLNSAP